MGFRKPRVKLTCPVCNKVFSLQEGEYKRRLSRTNKDLTCSAKCSGILKSNYRNNKPYKISETSGGKHLAVPAEVIIADEYTLEVKPGGVLVYTPAVCS